MAQLTTPPTAWRLGKTGKLDGGRAKVRELLTKESIPEIERDYLIRKVDALPPENNWVTIIACCQHHAGKSVLDLDIEGSTENI